MKINQFFGIASLALVVSSSSLLAQNFQTMPIASGYNEDVIANGVGPSLNSTTSILDGDSYVFVAKNFQSTSTSTAITYGVPVDGIITSAVTTTPGLSYQLGNLSAPNSLRLSNTNLTGTLVFATPKAATKLYMLSTSGSAPSTLNVTVNFSDGSSQVIAGGASIPDWYGGTDFAVQGLGRINRLSDGLDAAGGTNPRMYQAALAIDAANQAKPIQSVTITKTSTTTNGFPNIFAFSADAFSDCAAPTIQPVGTLTSTSAQISWTVPSTTTASSYNIYYSTTNTPPTSTTNPIISGFVGTTTTLNSLLSNTTYYYWVKTNCANTTGQSVWSFAGTFKTLCGPVTSLSENFDSYAIGTTLPDCWVRNFVNGTMSVSSTTPASGTRNLYQTNTSTQTPSTVVLPEFSNINAGTHWLKLKARVSVATGTLNVGYVTNPTDPSTFVLIQALSIANTNYTSTNPEYTVIVPSTVPANARLAVRNTADGKGYYWDDVVWEAVPSCFPPTALTTSAVTATSATLSWTAPSSAPASGYEYVYTTTNTAPTGSGTAISGITVTIPLPSSSTTYYLWVRSKCSTTSTSVWTSATVTTKAVNDECSAPTPITPGGAFGANPVIATTLGATATSDTTATHTCQTTGYNDTWYTVVVPASGNLTIETQSVSGSPVSDTVLGVYTGSCGSLTQVGCDDDSSSDGNFSLVSLTGQTPGATLLIGVWNYSSSSNGQFRISAYDATLATSETSAVKKDVKVYPNPFKDVIYISETKDIKSVTVYDVAGRIVKQVNDASKEIHLAELKEGLYMIKVSFKDGTESVIKAIKK